METQIQWANETYEVTKMIESKVIVRKMKRSFCNEKKVRIRGEGCW